MNLFSNIDSYVTILVAIGSSATTFLVTKLNANKDLKISDRTLLSEDEKNFRQELRATIDEYKVELKEARKEITELRKEVGDLHQINLKLTLENKQLNIKVDDLKSEVQNLRNEKSINRKWYYEKQVDITTWS